MFHFPYRLRTLLIVLAVAAVATGQEVEPTKTTPPKSIKVGEVLAILGSAKIGGQGDGLTQWNGARYGCCVNGYKQIKLPWNAEPQDVQASFAWRNKQYYLVRFEGPGFLYKRLTFDAVLTFFEEPAK